MGQITQAEIARKVGLSQQAVGFALGNYRNSRSKVSLETRQRILKAATELGYRPHRYAQVMRKGKSGVIGMIQFGGTLQVAHQRGIYAAKAVHEAGYHLLATDLLWYRDGLRTACEAILDAHAEGVILCDPLTTTADSELQRVRQTGMPFVSLSGVQLPGVPQVRSDVRQGMRDLTNHLLGLGCRRLALLIGASPLDKDEFTAWPTLDRVAGFRDATKAAGLSEADGEIVPHENPHDFLFPFEVGKHAMQALLQRGNLPEVAICSNDDWAIGALAACAEAGVKVPEDIGITGFDDTVMGQFSMVPLTTVAQEPELMGRNAVELLTRIIRGDRALSETQVAKTPCRLVVRKSCGASMHGRANGSI